MTEHAPLFPPCFVAALAACPIQSEAQKHLFHPLLQVFDFDGLAFFGIAFVAFAGIFKGGFAGGLAFAAGLLFEGFYSSSPSSPSPSWPALKSSPHCQLEEEGSSAWL